MFYSSKEESQILGFHVARGDDSCLENPTSLVETLEKEKVDILKLNCKNPPADLYLKLDALQLDYYVLGIVQEYKSVFAKNPDTKEYLHPSVRFEEYTLDKKELLDALIKDIFKHNTASYFKNPLLANVSDTQKQLHCLSKYIGSYCKELDASKYTHIMYADEIPMGFISSYKEGQGGGVVYAGILDSYVGRGYYLDLVRFIQNYGKAIEQKWGLAYAQIHHNAIQKTFAREGLKPQGYVLNIHINSCFGNLKHVKESLQADRK